VFAIERKMALQYSKRTKKDIHFFLSQSWALSAMIELKQYIEVLLVKLLGHPLLKSIKVGVSGIIEF
jgi:hypothetical protein